MELVTIAVVTALVEGIKTTTGLSGRFSFILSLVIGIILAVIVTAVDDGFQLGSVVEGLVVGLGASGFYSGAVKDTIINRDSASEL